MVDSEFHHEEALADFIDQRQVEDSCANKSNNDNNDRTGAHDNLVVDAVRHKFNKGQAN